MAATTLKINASDAKVVKCLKANLSIPKAASQLGMGVRELANDYYRLEPVLDPSLVITGTKAQVAKQIVAGHKAGLRWERLAHRSGLKVAEVKAIYETATGVSPDQAYCGKGRHYERYDRVTHKQLTAKKSPAKKPTAKRTVTKKQTGRKPATPRTNRTKAAR